MTTEELLRRFIMEVFYLRDPDDLTDETSLISSGIVDSTGILEVIVFIETEFGIVIEDLEVIPENLESISRIAAFVERKRQAAR